MSENQPNSNSSQKHIFVSAAVIFRTDTDGTKQVFATQRGYGEWKGWWEFPGGKIEKGETPEAALVREIREELTAEISAGKKNLFSGIRLSFVPSFNAVLCVQYYLRHSHAP